MSVPVELLEVLEHLVNTHPVWNVSLSQVEAQAKLAAVRAAQTVTEEAVSDVVADVVTPETSGNQFAAPLVVAQPPVVNQ